MTTAATVVTDWPLAHGRHFPMHEHRSHQLSIAQSSAVAMGIGDLTWVVPPGRALWIPAGVAHSVEGLGQGDMTTVWIAPATCSVGWPLPTVVEVDALVASLVDRLRDPTIASDARTRTEAVLFDVLRPAPGHALDLSLPIDERARAVAEALLADPADGRSLLAWGRTVGASDRTLQRAFRRETGLGFNEWRTRARITVAIRLLLTDRPITRIATDVGYATTSAFGAAFRRTTAVAPSAYRTRSSVGRGVQSSRASSRAQRVTS